MPIVFGRNARHVNRMSARLRPPDGKRARWRTADFGGRYPPTPLLK